MTSKTTVKDVEAVLIEAGDNKGSMKRDGSGYAKAGFIVRRGMHDNIEVRFVGRELLRNPERAVEYAMSYAVDLSKHFWTEIDSVRGLVIVRDGPTKEEIEMTERFKAEVEADLERAEEIEAEMVEAIEDASAMEMALTVEDEELEVIVELEDDAETNVEGLPVRTTGVKCVHCNGLGEHVVFSTIRGQVAQTCDYCRGTGVDPKMETETVERMTKGEIYGMGFVNYGVAGSTELSTWLLCHSCGSQWLEVDHGLICPECKRRETDPTGSLLRTTVHITKDGVPYSKTHLLPAVDPVAPIDALREQYEAEVASGKIRTLKSVCPQCGKAIDDGGKMVHGAGPYCVPCADGFLAYEQTEPKGLTEANRLAAMLPKDLVTNERGNIIFEDPAPVADEVKAFVKEADAMGDMVDPLTKLTLRETDERLRERGLAPARDGDLLRVVKALEPMLPALKSLGQSWTGYVTNPSPFSKTNMTEVEGLMLAKASEVYDQVTALMTYLESRLK